MKTVQKARPTYGKVNNANDVGEIIRNFRKSQQVTLDKVSGVTNIGMRFLSELERGKETAELGKVLTVINKLGLEVIIQPRGRNQSVLKSDKDNKEE